MSPFGHSDENAARMHRHSLLLALHQGRSLEGTGWMSGRFLEQMLRNPAGRPKLSGVSDQQILDLLTDLVRDGYAENRDDREWEGELYSLGSASFRTTAKGSGFCRGTEPADPDIADGRIAR